MVCRAGRNHSMSHHNPKVQRVAVLNNDRPRVSLEKGALGSNPGLVGYLGFGAAGAEPTSMTPECVARYNYGSTCAGDKQTARR